MKKIGVLLPVISQFPILNHAALPIMHMNTFFGVELDGKSARIPLRIRRSLLPADRGETRKDRSLPSDALQELGLGEPAQVGSGHLKVAMGTGPLGMHNTLRDPFTIEMRKLINQIKVLQQSTEFNIKISSIYGLHWPSLTDSHAALVIVHWIAIGVGEDGKGGHCVWWSQCLDARGAASCNQFNF